MNKAPLKDDFQINSEFKGNAPKKVKIQDKIVCKNCLGESGYTNDDLRHINTAEPREIKCKACGKVAIKIEPIGVTYGLL